MAVWSYSEIKEKFGTANEVQKKLGAHEIFHIERDVYSDSHTADELLVLIKRYIEPLNGVLTLDDAFYFHHLAAEKPTHHFIATKKEGTRFADSRAVQVFVPNGLVDVGKVFLSYDGQKIPVYDLERTLIELERFRNRIPNRLYKEVVYSYRDRIQDLDQGKLFTYLRKFPREERIKRDIFLEVF
jgi:hypothetical protein